ncbi:cytochrome P450 [Mycolicibacterium gadium]|uniref:cytochrome P450 n=1 Tax=Mycolicibacterium gadium TaxID=1794 RepID=UPI002FDCEFEE
MSPTARKALPPGPKVPAAVQLVLMMRWWPQFVASCRRRYGTIFTLRNTMMGEMVYLADPETIKTVFAGDPRIFHAGEANSMLSGLLGSSSVLVIDGDVHRERRKLMMAPFHRDAVARQSELMAHIAAENIAGWPVGQAFAVAPKTSEITLEVILRTVIGASDPARLAALRDVMPRLLQVGPWESLAIAKPKLQKSPAWRRFARNMAEADRLLYAEIAERRADPNLAERTDALAMLVQAGAADGTGMSDKELRDQLITLLVAGHDTTATGLAWALERLTRHPQILARAVAAAEAGDAAGDEYLDAIAKETLRIRPVVPDVGRILKEPVEVGGYQLPVGVMVVPSITSVHADPNVYPDPEKFDPGRMVGATLSPTTWFPFGGGNRRCLGAGFAMVEMRIVLREILRRVELSTTSEPGEKTRLKHVIMTPQRGGQVTVRAVKKVAPTGPAQVAHS